MVFVLTDFVLIWKLFVDLMISSFNQKKKEKKKKEKKISGLKEQEADEAKGPKLLKF